MKKRVSIFLILFSGCVFSDGKDGSDGGLHETCRIIAEFSVSTMRERQYGTPIVNLVDKVDDSEGWIKDVIYIAYEISLGKGVDEKESIITEFGNDSYLSCIDSFKGE